MIAGKWANIKYKNVCCIFGENLAERMRVRCPISNYTDNI